MNVRRIGWPVAIALGLLGWQHGRCQAQLFTPNAGIAIDSKGVLRTIAVDDPTGELTRKRLADAKAALNPRVAAKSNLRKVSLNRLERALKTELDAGRKPTDEMNYLAGLTRLEYVFCYPESRDIVVGGPAEGWAANLAGRVIGMESGWPVLQLQDLVVALRCSRPAVAGHGRSVAPSMPRPKAWPACRNSCVPSERKRIRMIRNTRNSSLTGCAPAWVRRKCESMASLPRRTSPRSWSKQIIE